MNGGSTEAGDGRRFRPGEPTMEQPQDQHLAADVGLRVRLPARLHHGLVPQPSIARDAKPSWHSPANPSDHYHDPDVIVQPAGGETSQSGPRRSLRKARHDALQNRAAAGRQLLSLLARIESRQHREQRVSQFPGGEWDAARITPSSAAHIAAPADGEPAQPNAAGDPVQPTAPTDPPSPPTRRDRSTRRIRSRPANPPANPPSPPPANPPANPNPRPPALG